MDDLILMRDGARRWLNGLRMHPKKPTEVRREYMPQSVNRTPLYTLTRIYIAELWLEMRK